LNCDFSTKRRTLTLQWHITSRCNLRCAHCYQDSYHRPEFGFTEFLSVIDQYKQLLLKLNKKGHINVTGGEPFLHEDFFDLLKVFNENKDYFSFGILTNGTFIDKANAKRLKLLNPSFVQVSIEGDEKTHNSIRGEGNLRKVIEAIKHLKHNGIKTLVSFTAHKENYKSFPAVAALCKKTGVFKLWTDRMVPFGGAEKMHESLLNPKETLEFFKIVKNCREQKKWGRKNKTIIELNRALQFFVNDNYPYSCKAGESLICLLEDGTVLPCRRLPIEAGNLKEQSLDQIYFGDVMNGLRSNAPRPEGCSKCSYFILCKGGARCISYAVTGNPFARDPGCPIL